MNPTITTDRLILRPIREEDVFFLVSLNSDPDVMRFIGSEQQTVEAVRDGIVAASLRFERERPGEGFWIVSERDSSADLGWVELHGHAGEPRIEAELGYRLVKGSWGHGFATEASKALITYGFEQTPVDVIFAETMKVNEASQRVMAKAGLIFHHAFMADWPEVLPDSEYGDVRWQITREQWADRQREVKPH